MKDLGEDKKTATTDKVKGEYLKIPVFVSKGTRLTTPVAPTKKGSFWKRLVQKFKLLLII